MNYSIEQLLSFAWLWVYPRDPSHISWVFALTYIMFFPVFALLRARPLAVLLIIFVGIAFQAAVLFHQSGSDPFSFPYGTFYYFLGTLPYILAGIVLSRFTARPLASLWLNSADALSPEQLADVHSSLIGRAKRWAAHTFIFFAALLLTPFVISFYPERVRARYRSAKFDAFVQELHAKRAAPKNATLDGFAGLRAATRNTSTKASEPAILILIIIFLIVASIYTARGKIHFETGDFPFATNFFYAVVGILFEYRVAIVLYGLLTGTAIAFIGTSIWFAYLAKHHPNKLVHGMQWQSKRAAQKIIAAAAFVAVMYYAVHADLFSPNYQFDALILLYVVELYVIVSAALVWMARMRGYSLFNLPAAAITMLLVSPIWSIIFLANPPPERFFLFFAIFVFLAADHVFVEMHGQHMHRAVGSVLHKWFSEAPKEQYENLEPVENLPVVNDNSSFSGIHLKLKRSQRTNTIGTLFFVLDARMGVNREELSLIRKYKLHDAIVYDSKARQQYEETAKGHLESTREHVGFTETPKNQLFGAAKTLYRLGRASVSTTIAALSLRITVHSLIKGVHIECKSMNELLEGENAIVTAARNVKMFLETAATFDGREEILEL